MNLIKVEGREGLCRKDGKNRNGSYTYYWRRQVPVIFENGNRGSKPEKIRLGTNFEHALKDAGRLNAELEAKLSDVPVQQEVTLSVAISEYLDTAREMASYREIKRNLEQFLGYKGDVPLSRITRTDVLRFLAASKVGPDGKRISVATVNGKLADLKPFFGYALDMGYLEFSPMERIKPEKYTRTQKRIPTSQETRTLLDACKPWMKRIIQAMYLTGGRESEVLRLRWEDVHLGEKWLALMRTKNRERKPIPHDIAFESTLENLLGQIALEAGFPAEGPVFVNGNGKEYTRGQFYIPFRRLVKRLGMAWLQPSCFRPLTSTEIEERSDNPRLSQLQLGHSKLSTTMNHYMRRNQEAKKRAAKYIEAFAREVEGGPVDHQIDHLAKKAGVTVDGSEDKKLV